MSVEENQRTLERAIQAWNAGDRETYLELYSPSIVHHGLGPQPFGPDANRGFYDMLWATFPHTQLEVDDTVADGDKIASRFRLQGTHQGDFMGIPATNRPFVLSGQTIMRFANGKVVERWTVSDMFGLMVQLGAVEPPPA